MNVEIPNFVTLYEEKVQAAAQLKREIQKLQQTIAQWLTAIPNKTVDRNNGKLKLQDMKTYGPVNRRHIENSLIAVLSSNNKAMNAEQVKQFSADVVKFIWDTRSQKITTKVVRTYSKKRKRAEELINADSEDEPSEEEIK